MSILTVVERGADATLPLSWETLAAAQQFAAETGRAVEALVIGEAAGLEATALARVRSIRHPLLSAYSADGWAAAVEQAVRQADPDLVLFPHTYQTRDYAPKVATRFGQVLVGDVVRLKTEGAAIIAVRQLFQGKLNADIRLSGRRPWFVSIQAGAWRADQVLPGRAPVEPLEIDLAAGQIRTRAEEPFRDAVRAVDLAAAGRIVAVGRGIREKDNLALVEDLARALGAEVAASRPICDNGWLGMERQVGSSGQTVAPKLYVAVGISGAIQHLVGMKGSRTIVAINKDPEAPIFEVADYGIAGDLFEVVPAIIEELRKVKG